MVKLCELAAILGADLISSRRSHIAGIDPLPLQDTTPFAGVIRARDIRPQRLRSAASAGFRLNAEKTIAERRQQAGFPGFCAAEPPPSELSPVPLPVRSCHKLTTMQAPRQTSSKQLKPGEKTTWIPLP